MKYRNLALPILGILYAHTAHAIRGLEFLGNPSSFGELLANIYTFGVGFVALTSFVTIVIAGVIYLSAGDNESRTGIAKKWIGNALFGLILALLSYLILFTINPDFVNNIDFLKNLKELE